MFFIAYAFKGYVHTFAGRVQVVSHSSCRTSEIFKYFCPLVLVSYADPVFWPSGLDPHAYMCVRAYMRVCIYVCIGTYVCIGPMCRSCILNCGRSCLFIKLKLGLVCMGRVAFWSSCPAPHFIWVYTVCTLGVSRIQRVNSTHFIKLNIFMLKCHPKGNLRPH